MAESCQSSNALHQINIFSWNGNYTLFVCLWIHIFWSVNEVLTSKSHFKSWLLVHLSKWFKGRGWQRFLSLEEFKGESRSFFRKVGMPSISNKCLFLHTLELFLAQRCYLTQYNTYFLSTYYTEVTCSVADSEQDIVAAFSLRRKYRQMTCRGRIDEMTLGHRRQNSKCVCWGQEMESWKASSEGGIWAGPWKVAKMEHCWW